MQPQLIDDNIDFAEYSRHAGKRQMVKPASFFMESAKEVFHGVEMEGDEMPWDKTHDLFRFRKGEVTLWHGYNGSGKSMLQCFADLWLIWSGRKVCIASFEMKPARTLYRMIRQGCQLCSSSSLSCLK